MQNINKTTMLMTSKVFQEIQETIGTYKAETGGMLGSSNGQIIDHFIFDKNAVTGYAEYNPNTQYLSDILNEEWTEQDIQLMGFIHSHPRGCTSPSYADEEYADRIMKALDMDTFFMPIVMTSYAGQKFSINTYVNLLGEKYNHLETCQLEIVDINEEEIYETEQIDIEEITELSEDQIAEIEEKFNQMTKPKTTNAAETQPVNKELDNQNHSPKEPTLFDRISSTVDLKVLEESLIVGIGCGGAREFYLDMARTGVGNFIFMDGDKVEVSNVGVQGSYQDEIGQYKTDCIREKILNINPKAHVISMPQFLKDDFSDEEFQEMIKDFEPENILLCGFTDDFAAQARTAKLAETLGINYLAAQHYALGIASEIVYWVPNISQATPEQLLASRYEEYENGYKNDVTSQGSPIFNTTRLNALCEKLALGILLFDNYPEGIYSAFLTMIPHKNFILIRHNPFAHLELGMETFFQNPYTFMDDVVWLSNDDLNPNEENEDDENVPFE